MIKRRCVNINWNIVPMLRDFDFVEKRVNVDIVSVANDKIQYLLQDRLFIDVILDANLVKPLIETVARLYGAILCFFLMFTSWYIIYIEVLCQRLIYHGFKDKLQQN
jgi:hypothetical protein